MCPSDSIFCRDKSCAGADASLRVRNFTDSAWRNREVAAKLSLADSQRTHKFFQQNLSGMKRRYFPRSSLLPLLVIIHNHHLILILLNR